MIVYNQKLAARKLTPPVFQNSQDEAEDSQDDPDDSFFRKGYQFTRLLHEELLKSREAFERAINTLNVENQPIENLMLFSKSLSNFGVFIWRLSFCIKYISRMELVTFYAR
jgi:hypothetical protein